MPQALVDPMPAPRSPTPSPAALRQRRYVERLRQGLAEASTRAEVAEARAAACEALLARLRAHWWGRLALRLIGSAADG